MTARGRRALLFDLDGTLCDSRPGIVRCLRGALLDLGHPGAETLDLDAWLGPPLVESFRGLFGAGDARVDEGLRLYRRRFEAGGMFENRLYPGIPEVLPLLAAGADLFVATNKPTVYARAIVRHFGVDRLFRRVGGSGLGDAAFDKAELIRDLLAAEALDPSATAMIGDRLQDMVAAQANGVRAVGVLWGYGSEAELRGSGARALTGNPIELPPLLDAILGRPESSG